jgi:hypothetical protein
MNGTMNNNRGMTFAREVDVTQPTFANYLAAPHGSPNAPLTNVLLMDGEVITTTLPKFCLFPNNKTIDARDWSKLKGMPTAGNVVRADASSMTT